MPVSDREFVSLMRRVDRHDDEIRDLQNARAEARGQAREGARVASVVVGAIGAISLIGNMAVTFWGLRGR